MRYRRHTAADFGRIERLDADKVARLAGNGIAVRRIPLPLAKTTDQLDALLDAALAGQTPYVGAPQRAWLEGIR